MTYKCKAIEGIYLIIFKQKQMYLWLSAIQMQHGEIMLVVSLLQWNWVIVNTIISLPRSILQSSNIENMI